jgi:general secretion pathway protein D
LELAWTDGVFLIILEIELLFSIALPVMPTLTLFSHVLTFLLSSRSKRSVLRAMMLCALMAPMAMEGAVADLAEAEVARRNQLIAESQGQMRRAAQLLEEGKHQEALAIFGDTVRTLPVSNATAETVQSAKEGYAIAAVARAHELLKEGRYAEAEALLKSVVARDMLPNHAGAKQLLIRMGDPDRYPPALTPQHVSNVQTVGQRLQQADSQYELGDFDAAIATYQKVLQTDGYNVAARRGMERAENMRTRYFAAARDHNRARLFNEVNRQWEDAVPPTRSDLASYDAARMGALTNVMGNREKIVQKMRTAIVPKVDFSGASFEEIIEFLRVRSRDLDPEGKGVDFVLSLPPEILSRSIDLSLTSVPLEELVRYVAEKAGATYKVDEFAVKFVSLSDESTEFLVRTYQVPPGFIETAASNQPAAAPVDPFAANAGQGGGGMALKRLTAREFLEARGVSFPEGATASYSTGTNRLVVRNTVKNLEIVDLLVEQAAASSPKQAIISVKMIEINQNNLEELGFDWLMGAFDVPGSRSVFASGGTNGNMQPTEALGENFPMKFPGTDLPVGMNPVTAGVRSSGEILGRPTLDALLGEGASTPPVSSRSPGQLAVSGVLTDPQFQVVVRAINQKKGLDFVAMPSIVAKSGQKATIELAREFLYPTEFDPPEIPQQVGQVQIGNVRLITDNNTAPITPSTPTTFEMRKLGTLLEMEPVISENGQDVDLVITPETTEFEGFIDYASDINNTIDLGNGPVSQPVDNRIIQPIFRTNKITTAVRVYDGSTVVLGGVIQDRRIKVSDKVPVIGSIPLVGRFWKSEVSQVETKNYIVFVTVRVIDPSGQPINRSVVGSAAGQ